MVSLWEFVSRNADVFAELYALACLTKSRRWTRQSDSDASARSIIPVNVFLLQSQDNTASGGVTTLRKKEARSRQQEKESKMKKYVCNVLTVYLQL